MKIINTFTGFLLHPVFLLLIIGILVSATVYSYLQYQDAQSQLGKVRVELEEFRTNPAASASEVRVLVDRVGRIVALPTDETPTVATITDVEKLKEQPFFANAKNGDKVLIFSNARKAYLYRPDDNKIIEVAPINVTQNQPTPPAEQAGDETSEDQDQETEDLTGTPSPSVSVSPSASPSPSGAPTPTP